MCSPAEDFVYQFKGMCYFTNGTERVRLMARQIYNQEETLHFDSDVGVFVAVTELGRLNAQSWNSQKDLLAEYRALVDTLCRHNYKETAHFTVQRRGELRMSSEALHPEPSGEAQEGTFHGFLRSWWSWKGFRVPWEKMLQGLAGQSVEGVTGERD